MIKKAIISLLALEVFLIAAILVSYAYDSGNELVEDQPQVEVFSDSLFIIYSDVTFNLSDVKDYAECKNIVIDMEILENVDRDKVFEMLDNGASLYVRGDDLSLQEIGDILNLDFDPVNAICGAKIRQVEIYKVETGYDYELNGIKVDIETAKSRFFLKTNFLVEFFVNIGIISVY